MDLEHDARRGHLDRDIAGARSNAGLSAGAHAFRRRRAHRDDRGGDLSRAATTVVPTARRCHQSARSRQYTDRRDPDLPDDAGAVLCLALARLLQDGAEGTGRGRAHRRREPAADDEADLSAVLHARLHLRRHLRLYPVAERVSLRSNFSDPDLSTDRTGWSHRRLNPRRRVLLGPADGGRTAGLYPGGVDLFLLCRALRGRADLRLGESITPRA